jgi:hypothetical protein
VLQSRAVSLVVAALVAVGFVVGLALDGVAGALVLFAVVVALITLSQAVWPDVHGRGRAARILVVAVIVVIAVAKLLTA